MIQFKVSQNGVSGNSDSWSRNDHRVGGVFCSHVNSRGCVVAGIAAWSDDFVSGGADAGAGGAEPVADGGAYAGTSTADQEFASGGEATAQAGELVYSGEAEGTAGDSAVGVLSWRGLAAGGCGFSVREDRGGIGASWFGVRFLLEAVCRRGEFSEFDRGRGGCGWGEVLRNRFGRLERRLRGAAADSAGHGIV